MEVLIGVHVVWDSVRPDDFVFSLADKALANIILALFYVSTGNFRQ